MSVVFKDRNQQIMQTEGVHLQALFRDSYGVPSDLDSFPSVTITQPDSLILFGPSSAGVVKVGIGLYQYDFVTEINSLIGVYTDFWQGTLNGVYVSGEFQFIVFNTELETAQDGYVHLGDTPGWAYSQNALLFINRLLFLLKARLNSSGLHLGFTKSGEKQFMSCDIYSLDELMSFLVLSLSLFNQTQYITWFTFEDWPFLENFSEILVAGAAVYSLSSKALIEKGREWNITDNGISAPVVTVADLLNNQFTTELASHTERLKRIKENFRSGPLTLLQYPSIGQGRVPTTLRVMSNFLRSRQIF